MTVLGQPVTFRGKLQLSPGGRGSVVDVTGELKVAIPLLGKKLEESTAPSVKEGYKTQQEDGERGPRVVFSPRSCAGRLPTQRQSCAASPSQRPEPLERARHRGSWRRSCPDPRCRPGSAGG